MDKEIEAKFKKESEELSKIYKKFIQKEMSNAAIEAKEKFISLDFPDSSIYSDEKSMYWEVVDSVVRSLNQTIQIGITQTEDKGTVFYAYAVDLINPSCDESEDNDKIRSIVETIKEYKKMIDDREWDFTPMIKDFEKCIEILKS